MRPSKVALYVALMTTLAAAAFLVAHRPVSTDNIATAQTMAVPLPSDGVRLTYPAKNAPTFRLPDGEKRTILSVLNVREKMGFGDFSWNEDGVPAGDVWIRVDMAHQLLSVFRAGHEIGTSVIIYGADIKETPSGVFPILQKAKDYHSRTYDAPMPFMLRLTADGVAIHGSDVVKGAATHGCVGVPREFAERLFAQVKLGDPVAILSATSPATPPKS